jgi:fructose-1,6-bisphosphatase II
VTAVAEESRIAELERAALAATTGAALACRPHVGRGDKLAADGAATEAMRAALAGAPAIGTVVIGEGEKDDAPMLYNGERLGSGGPDFDIAVDPLECTTFCAKGLPGSLATIAFAEQGTLLRPGPSFYMDKLVVPAEARGAIDITDPPEENVRRIAAALDKPVSALRAVVLDKPRHSDLIDRLRSVGISVATPSDGDVAGSLQALIPTYEIDLLMGVGGTPEGVMTACAAKAVGGGMQARLAPQSHAERRALAQAGLDAERVLGLDDLVAGEAFFVATGVTGGVLLDAPRAVNRELVTQSIVIAEGSVRLVETWQPSPAASAGPDQATRDEEVAFS